MLERLGEAELNEQFLFVDVSRFPDLERELQARPEVRT